MFTAAPAAGPEIAAPGTTVPLGATPSRHLSGGLLALAELNAGTNNEVVDVLVTAAPEQLIDEKPLNPELPNALDRYTNGVGPLNEPMPPRSWFFWSPVTSQLKPKRGEYCAVWGTLLVSRL